MCIAGGGITCGGSSSGIEIGERVLDACRRNQVVGNRYLFHRATAGGASERPPEATMHPTQKESGWLTNV